MQPRTLIELPPDYKEVLFLSLSTGRNFMLLNVVAIIALFISGMLLGAWLIFYHGILAAPLVIIDLQVSSSGFNISLIVLTIMVIIVHELLHGVGIRHYGHAVRYGFKWVTVYATTDDGLFWRDQFIIIAALPAIVLTIIGVGLSLFLPASISIIVLLITALNMAGAAGDLWMIAVARRYPANTIIRDEADGMRVFCIQAD